MFNRSFRYHVRRVLSGSRGREHRETIFASNDYDRAFDRALSNCPSTVIDTVLNRRSSMRGVWESNDDAIVTCDFLIADVNH